MKITYMGKVVRDRKGRFSSWKTFGKKLIMVAVLFGAMYATYLAGTIGHSVEYVQGEMTDSMPQKVEALKVKVIEQIRDCESAGHKEDEGIIILDSNSRMSIGQLQFQKATVIYYYNALYQKKISGKEATEIALDTTRAMSLAEDIVFRTDNGLKNWITCANKYNLSAKVSAIKSLEK